MDLAKRFLKDRKVILNLTKDFLFKKKFDFSMVVINHIAFSTLKIFRYVLAINAGMEIELRPRHLAYLSKYFEGALKLSNHIFLSINIANIVFVRIEVNFNVN